ncbi:hypothetical protein [Rhizobium sp. BK176]|uniref:hypothetical protein n=1 Tax=Rhizobium sp. BK176 TaxID=2587071 RepID=UPI0021699959|nr:hypothetical protein [Rhizobium sp. BK176]MCS4089414.1 hypothetical protein [Rhizobium sp. BK176]
MKIDIQFLTLFHGNTKQDYHTKERYVWASTEVELEEVPARLMEVVLRDALASDMGVSDDKVYAYDGHYWALVETTNESTRGLKGSFGWVHGGNATKGLKNFDRDHQRQFSWHAFGFRFFSRQPCGHAFATQGSSMRNYRPGDNIQWDDTPEIEARVRRYCEENIIVCEKLAYCRIDTPCYAIGSRDATGKRNSPSGRVFTPYGGFGDPVIDFAKAEITTERWRDIRDKKWRDRGSSALFFNPIEDYPDHDPLFRRTRALFFDLFNQNGWQRSQRLVQKAKRAEAFSVLKKLWLERYQSIDEDLLDEASEFMLLLADEGSEARACIEAWVDRPMGFF